MAVDDPLPDGLPEGVPELLGSYRPRLASETHGPLVVRLVARARPRDRDDARSLLTAVSGLVLWAEETGLDIDPGVLLEPDVIKRYAAVGLDGYAVSSVSITRRLLGRVAGAHGKRQGAPTPRGQVPPEDRYTPAEVDALLSWADAYPSQERRRRLLVFAALGLGCGLSNAEILRVRGTDVHVAADGGVTVRVRGDRPREVVCLRRFERLLGRLGPEAGDAWAFNPAASVPDPQAFVELVHGAIRGPDVPTLTAARSRVTWLCVHLEAGVRLDVLAAAAGLDDAHQLLARRAAQLLPVQEGAARVLLRDATRPSSPAAVPTAAASRPPGPVVSVPVPPTPPDPATSAGLAGYRSRYLDPRHLPTVRAFARATRPARPSAAEQAARAAAGLVGWAERHGLPTDLPGLLHPDVVDAWLEAPDGAPRWQEGTRAIRLRYVAAATVVLRPGDPVVDDDGPYTPEGVVRLRLWAGRQPEAMTRRALAAVLAAGLGAGLTAPELLRATGEHVTVDPVTGAVLVDVPPAPGSAPRTVAVLQEHEAAVLDAARRAGPGWLVDPQVLPSARVVERLLAGTPRPSAVPRLSSTRCRSTWLDTHLSSGTRPDVLLRAAGLAFNGHLSENLSGMPPPPVDAARAALRGP